MGTTAVVQTRGASKAETQKIADEVKATFACVEKLLDATDPQSEASRLASLSDAEILEKCSPEVKSYYETAFELAKLSDGAFNPRWRGHTDALARGCALENLGFPTSSPDMLVGLGRSYWVEKGTWKVDVGLGAEYSIVKMSGEFSEGTAVSVSSAEDGGKPIRDGRTGLVVSNGVASVMVIGMGGRVEASGLAVTLYILGPEEGKRFLDEKWKTVGVSALWTMKEGEPVSHIAYPNVVPMVK